MEKPILVAEGGADAVWARERATKVLRFQLMPLTKVEQCEDSGGEPVNKRNESRRLQMIVMTSPVAVCSQRSKRQLRVVVTGCS